MDSPVFVFDGYDLTVFGSVTDAEGGTEVYDLDTLEYFDGEGTVLKATADGYRVRLSPTTDRRPQELRDRLRRYLSHPNVDLDVRLADEPRSAADAILRADWACRSFRWFPWLDKRVNGTGPPGVA